MGLRRTTFGTEGMETGAWWSCLADFAPLEAAANDAFPNNLLLGLSTHIPCFPHQSTFFGSSSGTEMHSDDGSHTCSDHGGDALAPAPSSAPGRRKRAIKGEPLGPKTKLRSSGYLKRKSVKAKVKRALDAALL